MSKSLSYWQTFVYAFALFSMFFGSGNLVFPLQLGQQIGTHWVLGFLGLFVTGILLPFLGLFVIQLYRGSERAFFSEAGVLARFFLPLFTLSLLGSFGVIPRCMTVAHGGLMLLFPELPLAGFSFLFCLLCFGVCLKEKWMIQILGQWMTPLLLILLGILISLGVMNAPRGRLQELSGPGLSWYQGFLSGYQTLDLFAAFFFSSLIFVQIQKQVPFLSGKPLIRVALVPSILGASLLGGVYFCFVFLGAHYRELTLSVSPELILPTIAVQALGSQGALIMGSVICLSCLTTAVALSLIYARYLHSLFRMREVYFPAILGGTLLSSFLVSLLDFKGIARFLNPLLELTYPSMIVLTLLSLFFRGRTRWKRLVFYGVLFVTMAFYWTRM